MVAQRDIRLVISNDNDPYAFHAWGHRVWQTIQGRHEEAQRQLIATQDQEVDGWLARHGRVISLEDDGQLLESEEGRSWLRLEMRHALDERALALEQQEERLAVQHLIEKYVRLGQIPMQLGPPPREVQAWERTTIEGLRTRQQEERSRLTDRQRTELQQVDRFWDEDRRPLDRQRQAAEQRLARGGLVYTLRRHKQADQHALTQVQTAEAARWERETSERAWLAQRHRSESDALVCRHREERLATYMRVLEGLITGRIPEPQPERGHALDGRHAPARDLDRDR